MDNELTKDHPILFLVHELEVEAAAFPWTCPAGLPEVSGTAFLGRSPWP